MYLPLDPNKVEGMWDKLANSLLLNNFVYLINDNNKNETAKPKKLSHNEVNSLIFKMKKADYTRIGSSKMMPIPTHFAIKLGENNEGELVELIVMDNAEDTVRSALNFVIQLSFFEIKNLKKLVIPFNIKGVNDPEVNIITTEDEKKMIIIRK